MENPENTLEINLEADPDPIRPAGPTAVARRLRELMREHGLDRRTFVARFGWRNRSRGFRRLDAWLAGEPPNEDQLLRVVAMLGVGRDEFAGALREDHEAWRAREGEMWREAYARRAADPALYLEIPCGSLARGRSPLPPGTTVEAGREAAREASARSPGRRVILDCPDGRRFHYRGGEFEREGGLIVPWYPGFAGGRRYPAFGLR